MLTHTRSHTHTHTLTHTLTHTHTPSLTSSAPPPPPGFFFSSSHFLNLQIWWPVFRFLQDEQTPQLMRRRHGPHTPHRFLFLLAAAPPDDEEDDDRTTPPPPAAAATPDSAGEEEDGQGEELTCCWQSVSARWPPVIWKALPASEIPPPLTPWP